MLAKVVEEQQLAVRDCVAAIVCLCERKSGLRFVIGNAHIFWDPKFESLKLAQSHCFARAAAQVAERAQTRNVVLVGDWNSLPNSAVYELLTCGQVDPVGVGDSQLIPADVLARINEDSANQLDFSSAIPHRRDGPDASVDSEVEVTTLTWKCV